MNAHTLASALDTKLEVTLQEDFDHSGAQILLDNPVADILVSLDTSAAVVDEAVSKNCTFILSHHPLFFEPVNAIDEHNAQSRIAAECIRRGISVYAAHTNFDKLTAHVLPAALGFSETALPLFNGTIPSFGARIELKNSLTLGELTARVKSSFQLETVFYGGDPASAVHTIAFIGGSGSSLFEKIVTEHAADCILTGDITYHRASFLRDSGIAFVDITHFASERILLNFLKEAVIDCLTKAGKNNAVKVHISENETSPFKAG